MGIEIWIADALDDKALFAYQEGFWQSLVGSEQKGSGTKVQLPFG